MIQTQLDKIEKAKLDLLVTNVACLLRWGGRMARS